MTITELYHYAVSHGFEDLPIIVNYEDCYEHYGFTLPLEIDNIDADNEEIVFSFD